MSGKYNLGHMRMPAAVASMVWGVNDKGGGSEAALIRRSRSPVSAGADRRVDRDLLPIVSNRYCDDCVWGRAADQL